MVPNIGDSSTT
jgi:hypothetical protein